MPTDDAPHSGPAGAASGPAGPADGRVVPRFAGPATFARLPRASEVPSWDVAVVGVPFDAGTSYRPGARFGPAHVRQSSRLLRPYNPALDVSPFAAQQVVDAGDVTANPFDIAEAITAVERAARGLLAGGGRIVSVGGDHTIALPLLRAVHHRFGRVALVHFDAHLDTWDTYFGAPYTHGTPFRRAAEENLFLPGQSVHVGIRGPLYDRSDLTSDAGLGFEVISCGDVADLGPAGVAARIAERAGGAPLYVSVDIDVLDPAHAPGTGTPEAGGLTSRELLAILRGLAGQQFASCDVVEVSPPYDHAEITGIAAAHVIYDLITLMAT